MLHKKRWEFGLFTLLAVLVLSATSVTSRGFAQEEPSPHRAYLPITGEPADAGSLEAGHIQDDYDLAEQARQRNEPPFQPPLQSRATGPVNQVGSWGAVTQWPFAFASAANLPDGRLAVWGANNLRSFNGGNFTYSSIWDPKTNQFTSRNHSDHSMFCAIPTMMEDGRVFVNGGDGNSPKTSIFDYRTNQWSRTDNQNTGRWYPGSVALPGDRMFTMLGQPGGPYPEVWTEGNGWDLLTGANLNNGVLNFSGYQSTWLPLLHLMPSGDVFHIGPTQQMNIINPAGNGSISSAGLNNTWYPKYSSAVMYDEGKVLVAGGAANDSSNSPGTDQAMIIDFNGAIPTKTIVSSMNNVRQFNNGVMLPNGEVLIIGGNTSGREFSDVGTVLEAEIWNPTTQTFRQVANMSVPRNYHAVALLLPDGRVWSGGGGLCNCAADHPDHQVYSPPYLFDGNGSLATRPTINNAPASAGYGATLSVQATTGIDRFTMIKMSGVTHNLNTDQRFLNIDFTTVSNGNYQLTLHSNKNVLTPGYWMMFALDSNGVPSESHVIQVQNITSEVSVTSPGDQTSFTGEAVNQPLVFNNPAGGSLTFSATGLPNGLNIDAATGVISGVPTTGGEYTVTVTVSNGNASDSVTFDWIINQTGVIRYIRLIADSEVNGNPWTSMANFNVLDNNGNPIGRDSWAISADSQAENYPPENVLDTLNNSIWHTQWVPSSPTHPHQIIVDMQRGYRVGGFTYLPRQDASQNGTIRDYRFYVSTDGTNWGQPVAQGTFPNNKTEKTSTFTLPDPNQPPLVFSPGNQSGQVGSAINLAVGANDPDGDSLTFSASGLPNGLSINSNSGVIVGTLQSAADFNVTVSVDDGNGGSDSASFDWSVFAGLVLNDLQVSPVQTNVQSSFTADSAGGSNPRYKWLFGDGTAETDYSSSQTTTHTFGQPGRYLVTLTATDDSGNELTTQFTQLVHRPLTGNRPAVSMSIVYEERTGNDRVWNVNPDNDSVTVIDAISRQKLSEISVGDNPNALAVAPGGRIWVTNKGSATISVIDSATFNVVQTITLPGGSQPHGLVFSPNGNDAFVALEATGQLLKFNPISGAQVDSADVGPHPRHLSMLANSNRVYVSRFITPPVPGEATGNPNFGAGGGEVVVVRAGNLSIVTTISLQFGTRPDTEGDGRGIPNYLGPAVISPDGVNAWVPSKQDNIARGTLRDGEQLDFDHSVRSISSYINLSSNQEQFVDRIDYDNGGIASSGQFGRYGAFFFVALEGSREVAVVDAYARTELFRVDTGFAPQGVTVSADGETLFVHNFTSRTVGVYDLNPLLNGQPSDLPLLSTVGTVNSEVLSPDVLLGKQLFYDARDTRLALDGYMSCASCHNAGDSDGRVWDFTGFGEGVRNTISLQGSAGQGPLHWSANFDEVHDFEGQIRDFAQGTGLMSNGDFNATQDPFGPSKAGLSGDLDALAAYVNSLTNVSNSPYRQPNGSLTTAGEAGKQVFVAQGCASCHSGGGFTDSAPSVTHDVGTIKADSGQRLNGPLNGIDTPTLRGLWMTAPYLHDGSAPTLADAVNAHNGISLSGSDMTNLVAYLNQIDGREPAPVVPNVNSDPALTDPGNQANTVGDTVSLQLIATDPDGDSLTFSGSNLPAGLNLSNSGLIEGSPTAAGTSSVTITVNDGNGGSNTVSFSWTVNTAPPVNTAPTLTDPGNQTNTVGDTVSLQLNATDPDGDSLTFSGSNLPAGLNLINSGLIDGSPTTAGTSSVTITVNDGNGGSDTVNFSWTVEEEVVEPPTTGTGQITWEVWDTTWGSVLSTLRNDPDFPHNPDISDVLTSFEAPVNRANIFGQRISGYIYPPVSGDYTFWLASDDQGELSLSSDDSADNLAVIATVKSWTGSREWDKSPSQQSAIITLQAGQAYYVEALAQEGGGGDHLAVAWQIPGGSRAVIAGQYLSPVSGGTNPPPNNTPPVLNSPGNQSNIVGDTVDLQLTATDADGDALIFSSPSLPAGLNLNTTSGRITGSPTAEQTVNVNVTVSDGRGGTDAVSFLWTVTQPAPVNNAPVLSNPGNQSNEVDDSVDLQLAATDQDGDSLTFSASGLPAGLSLNANSGRVTGSPTSGQTQNVTVSVNDGRGSTDSATFTWTVTAPPPPPPGGGTGEVTWEVWNTTWGTVLTTLRNDPGFPNSPDISGVRTSFEAPINRADIFGQRISGYLYPPVTGEYTFWLASDDQGELSLSSDDLAANSAVIATVQNWTGSREWDKSPTQKSVTITLQAGQAYYIEAMAQEGGGGDHLAVAWEIPGQERAVIDGQYLAPVAP